MTTLKKLRAKRRRSASNTPAARGFRISPFDEKTANEAIAVLNRAGEALSRHGLKFFYHTHGYEFQPHGNGTLFDLMMAGTKPEFVRYEMDVLDRSSGARPRETARKIW